jgi:hypothetical protein
MSIPSTAWLPREFQFWPEGATTQPVADVQKLYEQGFAGAFKDDAGEQEFTDFIAAQPYGHVDGSTAMASGGFAGSGAGQLVIPFRFVEQLLPGCWPGAAQQRGDCVSHSQKNANLVTMCCDIVSGKPDEVTGRREGLPDIPPEGVQQGALSTEVGYWYRGYNGDGWQCEIAAKVACTLAALWPRKAYPELGIDLTRYSGANAGKYGATKPPQAITTKGQQNLIRTATRLSGAEQVRDFLNNGYGVTSCGGEGFSNSRNDDGVSSRKGSWAHAMAYIGFDDRAETHSKYGGPLVLVLNSWGKWNTGGRRILGTQIDIPEGSFWAKWSDVSRRTAIAMSGAAGWPSKQLPPFVSVWG